VKKTIWSAGNDPFPAIALLQSCHSAKSGFCELDDLKADVGDLNQSAKTGNSRLRIHRRKAGIGDG